MPAGRLRTELQPAMHGGVPNARRLTREMALTFVHGYDYLRVWVVESSSIPKQ